METLYVAFDDAEDWRILCRITEEFDITLWTSDLLIDVTGTYAVMPVEIDPLLADSMEARLSFCGFDTVSPELVHQ